jgi:uncharacterized RDD family membrane protein YckC
MSTVIDAPQTQTAPITYASFGARLVAMIIDGLVIWVLQMVVIAPILAVMGLGIASNADNFENMSEAEAVGMIGGLIAGFFSAMLVVAAISFLYFAFMESSKSQASLGKMALGIKVVDLEGQRISFGKALLRSLGKIVSQMIFYIGYIMAAFTDKKQGLHDMIAGTLVVKK